MNKTISNKQKPHSRLGIASFVLSLLSPLLFVVSLFIVFALTGHTTTDAQQAFQDVLSLWGYPALAGLFIGPLLLPLAFGLGIAGLIQNRRRKIFALLGVLISLGVSSLWFYSGAL